VELDGASLPIRSCTSGRGTVSSQFSTEAFLNTHQIKFSPGRFFGKSGGDGRINDRCFGRLMLPTGMRRR